MSPVKLTTMLNVSSVSPSRGVEGMGPSNSGRSGSHRRGSLGSVGSHSAAAAETAQDSSCKTARRTATRRFIRFPLSPGKPPIFFNSILTEFPPKRKGKEEDFPGNETWAEDCSSAHAGNDYFLATAKAL